MVIPPVAPAILAIGADTLSTAADLPVADFTTEEAPAPIAPITVEGLEAPTAVSADLVAPEQPLSRRPRRAPTPRGRPPTCR